MRIFPLITELEENTEKEECGEMEPREVLWVSAGASALQALPCLLVRRHYAAQWFPFKFPIGPLSAVVSAGSAQQSLGGHGCFNTVFRPKIQKTNSYLIPVAANWAELVFGTFGSDVCYIDDPVFQIKREIMWTDLLAEFSPGKLEFSLRLSKQAGMGQRSQIPPEVRVLPGGPAQQLTG